MPPVTPTRTRAIRLLRGSALLERDGDLALGDLFEGHRQVVLRARLDERRRKVIERAFAELVMVVVDLPGPLCRRNDQRGGRPPHVSEEIVDSWIHHVALSL